jgi:Ala-tRNA(Pro) deacylase
MTTATWIRNELDRRGIAYQERHHRDAYTAQEVAQREHVSGHRVAKVVGVIADGRPVELILPASRRVRLDWVRAVLGARDVRLASEDEMQAHFTDCEVGAVPALRHWPGVDVVMDGCLRVSGDILFHGGTHHDAITMRFDDWFTMVNPRVELFSEPAAPCSAEPPLM